jgi:hypothetical protein
MSHLLRYAQSGLTEIFEPSETCGPLAANVVRSRELRPRLINDGRTPSVVGV